MPFLIGQPITARELEQTTSPWFPEQFASMCDALAWAASGRRCPGLPSLTTRVNAKDGGIDAEWNIKIPPDDHPIPTPILGPGWNVFQYKKRDIAAQDRRRIISNLKSSLRGAVVEIVKTTGQHPDRYVLFVNVDLKHDQTAALKEAVLEGYDRRTQVHVEVAGAATLAALLNDHPHLRSAYLSPLSFKTWGEADRAHRSHKLFGAVVALVGREEEVKRLRALVDDPRVRVIVLAGSHDAGKSRLALETTKHRPHDIVVALDPRSMDLTDYRSLSASHGEAVCIVEDPDSETVDRLVDEVLTISNLKLLVTLSTSASAPAPAYGRDERVQTIHLQPLSYEDSRKLLKATGKPLDFEIEDWIIDQSGGVPGVLLAAASAGPGLRSTLGSFAEAVGKEYEKRMESELGPDALRCARLFSVLTHVGISGDYESELKLVCEVFGDGWTPHHALSALETLEKAGLARRGGSFAEITVPLLANHLLSDLLRGQADEMFALFGKLEESGSLRFLKRLREVKGPEVEKFWDALFDPQDGLLRSLDSALENAHLLRLVSGTVPERVLLLLEMELPGKSLEERRKIAGDQRRELMWAVEQLLFREKTSRGALRLLYLLAEAENENYGNNATGVLSECFNPLHPQLPLSLYERIEILREFLSDRSSIKGKLVALNAVGKAFHRGGVTIRRSTSAEPLGLRPSFTYGDIRNYIRDLTDILFSLAEEGDQEVVTAATSELPGLVGEMGVRGRPGDTLERLLKLVNWAKDGKTSLDVSSLVNVIHGIRKVFSDRMGHEERSPKLKNEFQNYTATLERLKNELEESNFPLRLKRWGGRWTRDDGDYVEEADKRRIYRYEKELEKLAKEAIENPRLFDDKTIEWLLSPSAQRSNIFFSNLGCQDIRGVCRQIIEQLGQKEEGCNAFAAYWGGWSQRDREAAEARLEELSVTNSITGTALVQATGWLGPGQAAVDRIKAQIQAGRVDPDWVERFLSIGRWIEGLTTNQFEDLLKAIAGENLERASVAIDMVIIWLHLKQPIEGNLADFAWRCLENDPVVPGSDEWHFDKLAAILAKRDPDRGFKLLETLVSKNYERGWDRWAPFDPFGQHEFLDVLNHTNRRKLLELVLNVSSGGALSQSHTSWSIAVAMDLEADRDILLEYARKDVRLARIIADAMAGEKSGFWPLALELVKTYPMDETLQTNLATGIVTRETLIWGSISEFYERLRRDVERLIEDPETPSEARPWLYEIAGHLKEEVTSRVVWEYDLDVNDLNSYIKDKNSPQRLWAIGRVLKYADWKTVRKLLTPEDIAEALPQVDLPDKKRKALERALEVWLHEK